MFAGDSVPGLGSRPGGLPLIWFPADMERTIERLLDIDFHALALGHHYRTLTLPRDSIHFGANAKAYLHEARKAGNACACAAPGPGSSTQCQFSGSGTSGDLDPRRADPHYEE